MEMYDLLQCVDRGLDAFGSNMKQTTYWELTSKEGISSDRILENPEAFVRVLHEVFREGFILAQRTIIKELKKEFPDLNLPASSYTLEEALEIAGKGIAEAPMSRMVVTSRQS